MSANRRDVLLGLGALGATNLLAARPDAAADRPIAQPAKPTSVAFLARAFALRDAAVRAGDQAYGAVVVKDGKVVGEGPSRVVTSTDATAHAEMEAIRDASRRLRSRDLSGCILYSSSPPCAMCETAAYWAGVSKKVHGRAGTDSGAPRYGGCQ
jgi:tRNA(Arg) A34 adenosine deaminase TadA